MKKTDVQRFELLAKLAEDSNAKGGFRRFYVIRSREGSNIVFGMYDYKKKRYAISNPIMDDLNKICNEIAEMIAS
jgi:hypothetical protein